MARTRGFWVKVASGGDPNLEFERGKQLTSEGGRADPLLPATTGEAWSKKRNVLEPTEQVVQEVIWPGTATGVEGILLLMGTQRSQTMKMRMCKSIKERLHLPQH